MGFELLPRRRQKISASGRLCKSTSGQCLSKRRHVRTSGRFIRNFRPFRPRARREGCRECVPAHPKGLCRRAAAAALRKDGFRRAAGRADRRWKESRSATRARRAAGAPRLCLCWQRGRRATNAKDVSGGRIRRKSEGFRRFFPDDFTDKDGFLRAIHGLGGLRAGSFAHKGRPKGCGGTGNKKAWATTFIGNQASPNAS